MEVLHGDCIEVLRTFADDSLDSCVCDPPYGLEFMGKEWDKFKTGRSAKYKDGGDVKPGPKWLGKHKMSPTYIKRPAKRCRKCSKQKWSGSPCKCARPEWEMDNSALYSFQEFCEAWAREVLRVLKPGAHLLAFGGTRTYHRMACAIEDAGFEIRDQIGWLYGSGFPKSLDVGKAIDRAAGATRRIIGPGKWAYVKAGGSAGVNSVGLNATPGYDATAPATAAAQQWNGWGTALKPAWEPIVVARKPLVGTVAQNVLRFGTGAINVDGCRVGFVNGSDERESKTKNQHRDFESSPRNNRIYGKDERPQTNYNPPGRWPANMIHDGSEEVLAEFAKFGEMAGQVGMSKTKGGFRFIAGDTKSGQQFKKGTKDTGTAARFFYCAKASKRDRDEGCEEFKESVASNALARASQLNGQEKTCISNSRLPRRNHHPTVKPTALMRYLVRLVTPPGGTVLDCFAGSGSTGKAAALEGFKFVGIEREAEYVAIANARINAAVCN